MTITVTEDSPGNGTFTATDPDGDQLPLAIGANGSLDNAVIVNGRHCGEPEVQLHAKAHRSLQPYGILGVPLSVGQ